MELVRPLEAWGVEEELGEEETLLSRCSINMCEDEWRHLADRSESENKLQAGEWKGEDVLICWLVTVFKGCWEGPPPSSVAACSPWVTSHPASRAAQGQVWPGGSGSQQGTTPGQG